MVQKIIKTIDLTDYTGLDETEECPSTIVRLISDTENKHMDKVWEALTPFGISKMGGYGKTPQEAVNDLVKNIEEVCKYLQNHADYLQKVIIEEEQ